MVKNIFKKAGLIESPSRAVFVLTNEGRRVVKNDLANVDNAFLKRYISFQKFLNPNLIEDEKTDNALCDSFDTPQDSIERAVEQINLTLSDDLLSEILKQSSCFFEQLVVSLLEKMGYGGSLANAGIVTAKGKDDGIDGIVREDKLGFDLIYIQAKRWEGSTKIGRPEIQKFVGALAGQGATKGLFVTTATFTKDAIEYAKRQHTTKIILVDGLKLSKLMIEYNLGVSVEESYEIKKLTLIFLIATIKGSLLIANNQENTIIIR